MLKHLDHSPNWPGFKNLNSLLEWTLSFFTLMTLLLVHYLMNHTRVLPKDASSYTTVAKAQ
jgi:hypothetical protein